MTDRQNRIPITGRSNRSARQENHNMCVNQQKRPETSGGRSVGSRLSRNIDLDSTRHASRKNFNDHVNLFRPLSPSGGRNESRPLFPAMLPVSQDPTIPPPDSVRKGFTRPLSCPKEWIVCSQSPELFERSAMIYQVCTYI
jgi:hypothetical protein